MTTRNVTAALRPLSPAYRRAVRDELHRRGLPMSGRVDAAGRLALAAAIFAVENELEHRSAAGGGCAHPQVAAMRAVRNVLLDEVPATAGGNETHRHLRWPPVATVAAVMHERRRRGGRFPPRSDGPECTRRADLPRDGLTPTPHRITPPALTRGLAHSPPAPDG